MALKDWKKNDNLSMPPEFQVWDKENERGYYTDRLILQKTRKNNGELVWAVGNSVLKGSVFKTKPQAMKYAKDYMRSH